MPIPGVTGSSDNRQPGTPTIGAATAGNASVSVAFTAPDNTGKPNTSLTYTATTTPGSFTGTSSSSPVTISGLTNGTSYTAVVKLNNTVQDSLNSAATSSFTPAGATTTTTTTAAPPFFPYFPSPTATISNLAYTANSSTTGTLSWSGSNISSYLFTGDANNYPAPYNYGAYTATWPGNLVNMVNNQSYTVTITVSPGGASQTITFTHSYTPPTTTTTTAATTTTTTTAATTTTTTAAPGCTPGADCGSGYICYPEGFYTWYTYDASCNCVYSDGFC
jgi:hypothetical protein